MGLEMMRNAFLLCLFVGTAFASDEEPEIEIHDEGLMEEEEEELEDQLVIGPHPSLETSFIFPNLEPGRVPFGKTVDVLVGLLNSGDQPFNITSLGVTLHSPFDYAYHVQNFSIARFMFQLGPTEQCSLLYT